MTSKQSSRQKTHPLVPFLGLSFMLAVGIVTHTAITSADMLRWHSLDEVVVYPGQQYMAQVSELVSANVAPGGLISIQIQPEDPVVAPHGSVSLTSIGYFVSGTAPVDTNWLWGGPDSNTPIAGCDNTDQCTFVSDGTLGTVDLSAAIGDVNDTVSVYVQEQLFADDLPDWAEAAIIDLQALGIITGYEDGTFGPGDPLTNGQILTLLERTITLKEPHLAPVGCSTVHGDVQPGHYAYDAYCLFSQQGWAEVWAMHPDESVTRAETARLIHNVYVSRYQPGYPQNQVFTDVPVSNVYFSDTGYVYMGGIMTGNPDGTFGLFNILNRAEAATILSRIIENI